MTIRPVSAICVVLAAGIFGFVTVANGGLFNFDEKPTSHTQRRQQYHGFSVRPPIGPGWIVRISEQNPANAIYRHLLPSRTHTLFAAVTFGQLDKSLSVEDALIPSVVSHPDRTEMLESTHERDTSRHALCFKYSIRYKDTRAANSPGVALDTVDRGLVCAHPTIAGAGIRISYSERGLESELDPSLWKDFDDFLSGVQIESAPGVPVS
jgi:hypothetical protein